MWRWPHYDIKNNNLRFQNERYSMYLKNKPVAHVNAIYRLKDP